MATFVENSKKLEFNLREIEYAMGTLSETVSNFSLCLFINLFLFQLDTVDSGKAEAEDLHAFKRSSEQTEELMDESENLLKEMEEQQETDRHERLLERFSEQFQAHSDEYKGLKPSIDRILSNKQLMRQLE